MQIDHASASSISTYSSCHWMYWLKYILGLEQSSGKAAIIGSIVHSSVEAIAKAHMKGRSVPIDRVVKWCWDYHLAINPSDTDLRHQTSKGLSADYKRVEEAVKKIVTHKIYSPLKSKLLGVEQRFKIAMPGRDWVVQKADGTASQFEVTGVIDMVREVSPDTVEIVDWKTGKRQEWWGDSNAKLDFYDLLQNVQLRIYHLAATRLYPQFPNVIVTIFYLFDGGPFSLPFAFGDIAPTINTLWSFMDQVQRDGTMTRNQSWRCKRMCQFGRNGICDAAWADLHVNGEPFVRDRYSNLSVEAQSQIVSQLDSE